MLSRGWASRCSTTPQVKRHDRGGGQLAHGTLRRLPCSTLRPLIDREYQIKGPLVLGSLPSPTVGVRFNQDSNNGVSEPDAHCLVRLETDRPALATFAISPTCPGRWLEAGEFLTAMWAMAVPDDAWFLVLGHSPTVSASTTRDPKRRPDRIRPLNQAIQLVV